jgi:lysophospholipase L1-like esterase
MSRLDPLLVPFWDTTTMLRESVMFLGEEDGARTTLLFEPDIVTEVTNVAGNETYTEGVDFVVEREARQLVRAAGSRMPWIASRASAADGALTHGHTIAVSYTHALDRAPWGPESQLPCVPRLAGHLRRRAPMRVCVIGDSISAGYDASGFHRLPPLQAPYATLIAEALEAASGAPVRLDNLAVAGWTAADGAWEGERIASLEPQLVVIAFGMNDASYAEADEFVANVTTLMDRVRAGWSSAEFLLVSPMLPTHACAWVEPARFAEYRTRLRALAGHGVAFGDVTGLWSNIGERKPIDDLSGNGLNHPNDFGHRLYAQAIIAALCPRDAE